MKFILTPQIFWIFFGVYFFLDFGFYGIAVFFVGDAEPGFGGGEDGYFGEAAVDGVVYGGGEVEFGFGLVAVGF